MNGIWAANMFGSTPGMNVEFVGLDVSKKVIVPVSHLLSGGGVVFGSFTKNV